MSAKESIVDFIKNLRFFLFSHKGYKALTQTQQGILMELIQLRYHNSEEEDIQLALEYLRTTNSLCESIPYRQVKSLSGVEGAFDREAGLPYIVHKGKRLYYPKGYTVEQAKAFYRYSIESEDIVGEGYCERTPHQYQSEGYEVMPGDVLIDAGVAEGLFSLDLVEKVSKIYLVECDSKWWKPLQYTFRPWREKVVLIKKYLSNKDDANNTSLSKIIEMEPNKSIFVKMDIEGFEVTTLLAARKALQDPKTRITLSCCTYHRTTDFDIIRDFFKETGYQIEGSKGYILSCMNDPNGIYSLRHGIIRAKNGK